MPSLLKDLFSSKKFIVMLSSVVGYVASRFGLDVPQDAANGAVTLVGAWIVGQGIQDAGKEIARTKSPVANMLGHVLNVPTSAVDK